MIVDEVAEELTDLVEYAVSQNWDRPTIDQEMTDLLNNWKFIKGVRDFNIQWYDGGGSVMVYFSTSDDPNNAFNSFKLSTAHLKRQIADQNYNRAMKGI